MDETITGSRDSRGEWHPNKPLEIAPFYRLPWNLRKILAWIPEYVFPWNALFALSALAYWFWVLPPMEDMQALAWSWVAYLLVGNVVAVAVFYGVFEFRLYRQRAQGTRFKYNPAFPGDTRSRFFWFGNQNLDCAARTFLFGVPIWTGLEVIVLWCYANGWVVWLSFADHPVWLAALFVLVPVLHELHFYCIHRLIHEPWLYRHVHSVHHRSVNPSPWSSLSMHPIEHLLYFSVGLWHLILPSHPLLALFQINKAGFGAIPGHVGFDKMEISDTRAIDSHAYGHYLHHKYFEVNYGDGLVPLDKVFGTWHDGSDAAASQMRQRLRARRERERAPKE